MIEPHEIHHRTDGSIDFDFYRARAVALRSQAIRDIFGRKAPLKLKLTLAALAGLVAFALAVASQTALAGGW